MFIIDLVEGVVGAVICAVNSNIVAIRVWFYHNQQDSYAYFVRVWVFFNITNTIPWAKSGFMYVYKA